VVGRGEVLERMTTVTTPSSELLEALWQSGGVGDDHRLPVLLCPPHPRLGGSMDSAVLAELVWHLGRRRHPTLRFNHRGVGASQGPLALPPLPCAADVDVDLGPLVDDARAALDHLLASTGARTAAVVGVSVGALVAAQLLHAHDAVERGVLVAPPVGATGTAGAALDVGALVGRGCVVAVAVGDDDRVVDVEGLRAALGPAPGVGRGPRAPGAPRSPPSGGLLHVVPGADHLFQRGLTALARWTAQALGGGDDEDVM
jgi:alpha/beta superfamily hydrolase